MFDTLKALILAPVGLFSAVVLPVLLASVGLVVVLCLAAWMAPYAPWPDWVELAIIYFRRG